MVWHRLIQIDLQLSPRISLLVLRAWMEQLTPVPDERPTPIQARGVSYSDSMNPSTEAAAAGNPTARAAVLWSAGQGLSMGENPSFVY